jgi:TrmH family RNA methyltransferase
LITSRENPIVKKILKLHTAAGRKKVRQYFTEGVRSVEQALRTCAPVAEIVYSAGVFGLPGGGEVMDKIRCEGLRTVEVSDSLFKFISDTDNPQYIMAVINIEGQRLDDILKARGLLLVITDGIRDPGNLGTIIRTADAAGASAVLLLKGTVDPYNPKVIRSTMGSIFCIPVIQISDAGELFARLKKRGVKLIASSPGGGTPFWDADLSGEIGIIIGSEANGISEQVLEYADVNVVLPMPGRAESLNASVACGILIYKALEQRVNITNSL